MKATEWAEALHLVLNDMIIFLPDDIRNQSWSVYRDAIHLLAIGHKKGLPVTLSFAPEVDAVTKEESSATVTRVRSEL